MDSSPATTDFEPLQAARAALDGGNVHQAALLAASAWRAASPADERARAEAGYLLCTTHHRMGRWPAMLESSAEVLPLLHRTGAFAREIELLRWVTLAACELGRFDHGLRCATEACKVAQADGDRSQQALSLLALAICIERMGDPWQAYRLMDEARVNMRGVDDPYTHCMILNNLCAVDIGAFYLLRDTAPSDARKVLERAAAHAREAQPLVSRLPDIPFFAAILEGNLAEALVHLGGHDEAQSLLDSALARVVEQGNATRGWRIRYARSELLLARGEPAAASRELTALWHEADGSEQTNTMTRVHDALYRAWRMQGEHARALEHLERFEALERKRVVAQLQAQSSLFVTRVEAERSRQEAQAERLRAAEMEADALRDPLTGLGNRRHLDRRLPAILSAAERAEQPLCMAVIDLDHFKQINDRHGHGVGDQVLLRMADLLRANTRASDLLVRLGGEEFLVVFADTPLALAQEVSERLREQVQAHAWTGIAPSLSVTLSIGLAASPPYTLSTLMQTADEALYRAKTGGRNRVML